MAGYQILAAESVEHETLLDHFFEFLDGSVASSGNIFDDLKDYEETSGEDDGEEEAGSCRAEKKREFWESLEQLIQASLFRTSSIETRIRQTTKDFLRDLESGDLKCCCGKDSLQELLAEGGPRPEIPSAEHTYLEVLDRSNPKRATIRVIVELNFQAEFEMAKASDEYNRLIGRLPAVFVGKAESLRALIEIICSASKRCMRDRNVHIGPWRKHKYMQAKWLGTTHDWSVATLSASVPVRSRPKQGGSLLTHDLGWI